MNVRIPVVARLGTASGSRIFVKLCRREAPSTWAASSRSLGICLMERAQQQVQRAYDRYLREHGDRQNEPHDRRLAAEFDPGESIGRERTDDQTKDCRRTGNDERVTDWRDEITLG